MTRFGFAAAAFLLLIGGLAAPAWAQEEAPTPPHQAWSFDGMFGTYDPAALQRGFQVYREVCSACHPLKHLYYRDLAKIGYSAAQIEAFAANYQVTAGPDDKGQMYQRPARPSDPFVGPFPNDEAARAANNGALPPDLSMVVKARDHGPDYVYALVGLGFTKPPPGFEMRPNMYYNKYFPGQQIHMPPPLTPDRVTYADGTKATVPQMAHDVVMFLSWASEPNLDERHRMGFKVILFLIVAIGVFYAAKRKLWAPLHGASHAAADDSRRAEAGPGQRAPGD